MWERGSSGRGPERGGRVGEGGRVGNGGRKGVGEWEWEAMQDERYLGNT